MNLGLLVSLIIGGLLLVALLVPRFPTPRSRTPAGTPTMFRDDDRYWYGRDRIYHNPDDPAVLVPRRYTGGYTLNVGHPLGKLILIALLLLIVALALLTGLGVIPEYGCHPDGCHW